MNPIRPSPPVSETPNLGVSAKNPSPHHFASSMNVPSASALQLTANAQQIHKLAKQLSQQPGFDAHKVARLQAAIDEGRYEIDAQTLAQHLLELEEEIGR